VRKLGNPSFESEKPRGSCSPSSISEQRTRRRELSSRPPDPRKSFAKDLCHPRSVFSHPTSGTPHRGSSQRASENAGPGAAVRELRVTPRVSNPHDYVNHMLKRP
jgi:hypothetical protein